MERVGGDPKLKDSQPSTEAEVTEAFADRTSSAGNHVEETTSFTDGGGQQYRACTIASQEPGSSADECTEAKNSAAVSQHTIEKHRVLSPPLVCYERGPIPFPPSFQLLLVG